MNLLILNIPLIKPQTGLGLTGGRVPVYPPRHPPGLHHPGYTSALHPGHGGTGVWCTGMSGRANMVVGLISVAQLTSAAH